MEEKNLGGRPRKEFDVDIFEQLCEIQCTKDEICAVFRCDEKTLTRWCKDTYDAGFSDIYKQMAVNGKTSLRRIQFDMAKNNPGMAIWLGKQYLGQADKQEQKVDMNTGKIDDLLEQLKD